MTQPRWPWFGAAALLGAAAAATASSTWLYWLPCRGSMLVGTIAESASPRRDFTDACLQRMDTGTPFSHDLTVQVPGLTELTVTAYLMGAAAWLVLVVGLPWSAKTRILAALVSVPGLASAVLTAIGSPAWIVSNEYATTLLWLLPPTAFICFLAVNGWPPDLRDESFVRVLLVLWGATAFDFPHQLLDYAVMSAWSSANWDSPPGTGLATALTLGTSAAVTLLAALRAPQAPGTSRQLHDAAPGAMRNRRSAW